VNPSVLQSGCQGSDAGFLFVPPAILSKRPSSVGSYPGATLAGTQAESTVEDFCFMVVVPLTQGRVALIDDEDAERVLAFKWTLNAGKSRKGKEYASRQAKREDGKKRNVFLHRFILNAPKGIDVDHEDNNGLNCQRYNLRLATRSQNNQNRKPKCKSSTGFKGVYRYSGRTKPFYAFINLNGKRTSLGYYRTAEEAARAYDAKAKELFKEFARLNFPGESNA